MQHEDKIRFSSAAPALELALSTNPYDPGAHRTNLSFKTQSKASVLSSFGIPTSKASEHTCIAGWTMNA